MQYTLSRYIWSPEAALSPPSPMSWFGGTPSTTELDAKVAEATSELIPDGEVDLPVALEITDVIRSKKVAPKLCMRALKKRLTMVYSNPNLLRSTLKLVDLCVKNGGQHFLNEVSSKEFVDYLVDYVFKVHYDTRLLAVINNEAKLSIGEFILSLLQEWSQLLNLVGLGYLASRCTQLGHQGYNFPERSEVTAQFADAQVPPDWVDADECMICYDAFSVLNRKHHCRSCGGVFCQKHSSHTSPLVSLGIMEPVRVCDNCYEQIKLRNSGNLNKIRKSKLNLDQPVDEDEQLRRAIELSLKESGQTVSQPQAAAPPPTSLSKDDEEDDEMKAALAASLREFEQQEATYKQRRQQSGFPSVQLQSKQLHLNLYDNLMPSFLSGAPTTSFPRHDQPQPVQQVPPPQHRELSQADEDAINVFVTMMSSVRFDRSKQANILHDTQLNELHNKVVQLKPQLNRATREAIERYETFLEMNNKILTITRLYDQYLESKLNSLYGAHNVNEGEWSGQNAGQHSLARLSSGPAGYNQPQGYSAYAQHPQQGGYQLAQATGQQSAQATGQNAQPRESGYGYPAYLQGTDQENDLYVLPVLYNHPISPGQYEYAQEETGVTPAFTYGPLEPPESDFSSAPQSLPRQYYRNVYPTESVSPPDPESMAPSEPMLPPERQNTLEVEARFPPIDQVSYERTEPHFPTIPTAAPQARKEPPQEEALIEL